MKGKSQARVFSCVLLFVLVFVSYFCEQGDLVVTSLSFFCGYFCA